MYNVFIHIRFINTYIIDTNKDKSKQTNPVRPPLHIQEMVVKWSVSEIFRFPWVFL